MAKLGGLTAQAVAKAKKPGMYADGGGLYLQVTGPTAKSWVHRFMLRGRARTMGLGPLHTISLAEARQLASDNRRLLLGKLDPIDARKAERFDAALEAAKAITFQQAAEAYIESHKAGWRNAKHADQWVSTLETYVYPVFGELPVQAVDVGLVAKVLEPIWTTKTETASRLRGRIEAVLDWAKTRGYRSGENPARWRGHLENILPGRRKVRRVQHHPALPYAKIGAFMADLRQQEGVAARALEFVILTAARTGEVRGATWEEIDVDEALWTVPGDRIKGGKEHRVPLSAPALSIGKAMVKVKLNHLVFPGAKRGKPLSERTLLAVVERMGWDDLTVHGFRSTFRDWAAEQTNYPREVAEMALAHAVGDQVEAAYRRGDLFEKRRRLMDEWAAFCGMSKPAGKVVPMRRAAK